MNRLHGNDINDVEDQRGQVSQESAQEDLRLRHVLQHLGQLRRVIVPLDLIDDPLDVLEDHRGRPGDRVRLLPHPSRAEQGALHQVEELADQTYAAERCNVSPRRMMKRRDEMDTVFRCLRTSSRKHPSRLRRGSTTFETPPSIFPIESRRSRSSPDGPKCRRNDRSRSFSR